MQAFFEAGGSLRPQSELAARLTDVYRIEVRRLQQHRGRLIRHLRIGCPHNARNCLRLGCVGDQEDIGVQNSLDAVERPDLLSRPCPAYYDAVAAEPSIVEGV